MPSQGRSLELRVGIFVILALLIGSAVTFTLGDRSSLFSTKRSYYAIFSNVDGLRPGSPVRISGLDVGTVGDITFLPDGRCSVQLNVQESQSHLVTAESVVTLGSKGLLGDKLVDISPGTGTPIEAGHELRTEESAGLFGMLGRVGELADGAEPVLENVREFTATLADEQFRRDIQGISHNIAELTRMAQEEDGTVRRLLTDPVMADQVTETLSSVRLASTELARTARNVRLITDEIATGDGTAHRLIYDQDGARLVSSLADTADEAATILRDARSGQGNLHTLLYGDEGGELLANLGAMSTDLRAIVADVRAGRGTIGALLVDPSIYEDVRRIVGNVERNDVLRALVRYSIREDEASPPRPRPTPVDEPVVADEAP